ncbi:Morn repeat protein [Pandoravirus inopinatum]|uniref:Morn repeat protein n=1 Tax=Pandoravirus inopinatum TaxID=1605721 RepID=A0A0B5J200_9VIRU|nr:Morn repeat protein [Pandoravirus inopinatum]AJF97574.1 Morn repeat protein [Pandoravirus inopinatum]
MQTLQQSPTRKTNHPSSLHALPPEIVIEIIGRLTSLRDLAALGATCRAWYSDLATGPCGRLLCLQVLPMDALKAWDRRFGSTPSQLPLWTVYGLLVQDDDPDRRDRLPCLGSDHLLRYWGKPTQDDVRIDADDDDAFSGHGIGLPADAPAGPYGSWGVGEWKDGEIVHGLGSSLLSPLGAAHIEQEQKGKIPDMCTCDTGHAPEWSCADRGKGGSRWKFTHRAWCPCSGSFADFTGAWAEGLPINGTATYGRNAAYQGHFCDGIFHGAGTLATAEGNAYTGEWRRGRPHGSGAMTGAVGVERLPFIVLPAKSKKKRATTAAVAVTNHYRGEWRNGKRHGEGTQTWTNGRRYDGRWHDNLPHGEGVCTTPDGITYRGSWHEGRAHGLMESTDADGRRRTTTYWIHGHKVSAMAHRRYQETGKHQSTARCIIHTLIGR